jgi:hypothetical protein
LMSQRSSPSQSHGEGKFIREMRRKTEAKRLANKMNQTIIKRITQWLQYTIIYNDHSNHCNNKYCNTIYIINMAIPIIIHKWINKMNEIK